MASQVVDKFEFFPKLPPELRRQIWFYSFRKSKGFIVELESSMESKQARYSDIPLNRVRNPTALSVNRESRAAALEKFVQRRRPVRTVEEIRQVPLAHQRYLFINPTIDNFTFRFSRTSPGPASLSDASRSEIARFKRITISYRSNLSLQVVIAKWVDFWIRALPNLVEVKFRIINMQQITMDLVKAKDAIALLRSKILALENQEREAGSCWKAPRFKVILQERLVPDDWCFRYEARVPIEDEPNPTPA